MKLIKNQSVNFKNLFIKNQSHFLLINIYILLIILVPKSISSIFSYIPIRLSLSFLLLLFLIIKFLKKEIALNNVNIKYFVILFTFFAFFSLPSIYFSKDLIKSLYTLAKFLIVFALFLFLIKINFTKKQYKQLLATFVFSTIIVLLYALIEYFFLPNLFNIGIEKYPGARGRVSSTFFNTIYLGMYINFLASYFFYIYSKCKSKKSIIFFYLLNLFMYVCILLTFTRSSLLIYFLILFLLILIFNKSLFKKRFFALFLSIILISTIIPGTKSLFLNSLEDGYLIMANYVEKIIPIKLPSLKTHYNFKEKNYNLEISNSKKIETIKEKSPVQYDKLMLEYKTDDYSIINRKEFLKIAKRIIKDNVFSGVGLGTYIDYMNSKKFDQKYPDYNNSKDYPHSGVILMAAETGILSTFFFFSFIVSLSVSALLIAIKTKSKKTNYYISIITFIVSLGFLIVNIIAENPIYDAQILPLFLIIIGIGINYSNNIEKTDIKNNF